MDHGFIPTVLVYSALLYPGLHNQRTQPFGGPDVNAPFRFWITDGSTVGFSSTDCLYLLPLVPGLQD